jgi:hypothetical protein
VDRIVTADDIAAWLGERAVAGIRRTIGKRSRRRSWIA